MSEKNTVWESFTNLFSREGRSENKEQRSDTLREKAREAQAKGKFDKADRYRDRADDKEERATTLAIKAKGGKFLTPSDSPATLWRAKDPWGTRAVNTAGGVARATGVKTKADTLRTSAIGYRPPDTFRDMERRATIAGALNTLQLAGLPGWAELDLTTIKTRAKGQTDADDANLLKLVRKGSQGAWSKGGLKGASEYMRQVVIKNGLNKPAWAYRGIFLLDVAKKRMAIRTAAEGTVAAGLSIAAGSATGTIIGAPAGAVLAVAAGLSAGAAARTQVELQKVLSAEAAFQAMVGEGLEEKGLRDAATLAEQQARAAARDNEIRESLAKQIGEAQGAEQSEATKVLVGAAVLSVGILITSEIIRRRNKR